MSTTLEQWWDAGTTVHVSVGGLPVEVFVWHSGPVDSPTITLLHGWPTSSWDWAPIAEVLARGNRVVAPDFLGLGRSSKGDDVPYDFRSQADALVSLWALLDVHETRIAAHDFGTIVAQELLARRSDGDPVPEITEVTWLNGSLDPSRYEPTAGQLALLDPEHGPTLAALVDEQVFAEALGAVHAQRPPADVLTQHWRAMSRADGHLGSPRFLRYIPDRAAAADRLLGAFTTASVPMRCIWGLADPVSGRAQLNAIRAARADIDVVELADAGHYPHTERPAAVIEALDG